MFMIVQQEEAEFLESYAISVWFKIFGHSAMKTCADFESEDSAKREMFEKLTPNIRCDYTPHSG